VGAPLRTAWQDTRMKVCVTAVIRKAVRLLGASSLGPAYEEAWREWSASGDEQPWGSTSADGLTF
jgi:hypothetical protein